MNNKEPWEVATEIYKYNVGDINGNYIGSANTKERAEKMRAEYEEDTGLEAYVFDNSVDYTGPVRKHNKGGTHNE